MQKLDFFAAVSLTNQTTRQTTTKAIIDATPTDGNLRVSSVAGEQLGVDYQKVMDKGAGQYVDIKLLENGDMYIYLVPQQLVEDGDVRGGKLAANAVGSNLTFSNKAVYNALGGVPSDPEKDTNITVRWELSEEGIDQEDGNGNVYTFFKITELEKKETASRRRSDDEDNNETSSNEAAKKDEVEVGFD